jgi:putative PIG3 family NAD(P)H quinone oxidoreductase
VLVDVAASALNRADLLQAAGKYPPPPGESDVLGLECAGVERATGRRVMALVASGGMAEVAAIDSRLLMEIPENLSLEAAAAIPEAWLTGYINLFGEAGLSAGERVLIHAGGSGVGTAAIQLAKRAGCRVLVTARTSSKLGACRELGADVAIDTSSGTFAEAVAEATDGEGVSVILDPLGGGDAVEQNVRSLAHGGRLVVIGLMSGASAKLHLPILLGKRARIIASTLRSRPVAEKAAWLRRFERDVLPGFTDGRFRPIIDSTYPLERIREAFLRMQENRNVGKIVVALS